MLALFLLVSCAIAQQTLVWSDEFDEFDLSKWQHEITLGGGGNWEFEYYTNNRSNSFVRNGILYVKPTLTADLIGDANVKGNGFDFNIWGASPADLCTGNAFYGCERTAGGGGNYLNPIQSARVRTVHSYNFKYGRVEVRAQLPRGDWMWPAIWMMPHYNSYGEWPASGEIDIVESRGNDASYSAGGCNTFGSTLHWGPYWAQDAYIKTHAEYTLPSGDFSQDFHLFGISWDSTGIVTTVDNNPVLKVNFTDADFWTKGGWGNTYNNPWQGRPNAAPFDQEFFFIFNVAVGGINGYFPDGVGGKPWSDSSAHAVNEFYDNLNQWWPSWTGANSSLQIDYIRVYQ